MGTDTIIVSGGRIGGNISVSGGNDSITVTGGEIVGEIRTSMGNDTLTWDGGGIIRSAILMDEGNDRATLRNLNDNILAQAPILNGGNGSDLLTFDNTTSSGAARYTNWETVNLSNGSRFDFDGNFVLGDSVTGSGVFNIDASSVVTSTQGSITPFTAGQRRDAEQRRDHRPEQRQYPHQRHLDGTGQLCGQRRPAMGAKRPGR